NLNYNGNVIAAETSHAPNCASLVGAADIHFHSNSFDTCQLAIGAGQVDSKGNHFENPGGDVTDPFVSQNGGQFSSYGDLYVNTSANTPICSTLVSCSSGNLDISAAKFQSGRNVTNAIDATGCVGQISNTLLLSGFTNEMPNGATAANGQTSYFN